MVPEGSLYVVQAHDREYPNNVQSFLHMSPSRQSLIPRPVAHVDHWCIGKTNRLDRYPYSILELDLSFACGVLHAESCGHCLY